MPKTIRELREARHWSQFELAVRLGVRPETVHLWERGKTEPYGRNLLRLAEVFDLPAEEIQLVHAEDFVAA